MLARHAENMFWAGRYLERANDTARMLDVTYHGSLQSGEQSQWDELLTILRLAPAYLASGRSADDSAAALAYLLHDPDNPGSIVSSVAAVRTNLRAVRDRLPHELWEHANRFHLELAGHDLAAAVVREPYAVFDLVRRRCQTLFGVISEVMPRDDGFRFLEIGTSLERALMTCRLLRVRHDFLVPGAYDEILLTLRVASALEAYRRTYQSSADPNHVARLLLLSSTFPRSVLFCLGEVEDELGRLARPDLPNRPLRLAGKLRAELEFTDPVELTDQLASRLESLEDAIRHIAESMGPAFFRSADEYHLHAQWLLPSEATW